MLEPMRRRVVEDNGWLKPGEFLEGVALCQLLPGATVVQAATYVGQRLAGMPGAMMAGASFILPAFVLMLAFSWLYEVYGDLSWVKSLSQGLGAVVIALLLQALWGLSQAIRRSRFDLGLGLAALTALYLGNNYLAVFLGAGLLRLVYGLKVNPAAPQAATARGGAPALPWRQMLAGLVGLTLMWAGIFRIDRLLGQMALIFLKIGSLSFGGGYVMIPILQWEVVEHFGWLSLRQFLDGILASYATPGPLLILATFVGYGVKGWAGAAVATVSVFLPPMLFIIFLTPMFQQVKEARWMRELIQGILAALVGMLALVTLQMGRSALTDAKTAALMLAAAIALLGFQVSLPWVVIPAAVASVWFF
jgi:chromate transporter